MPLVEINVAHGLRSLAESITKQIPSVVAEALSANEPGGALSAGDIEVRVRHQNTYDSVPEGQFVPQYQICVIIFANDFPSRKANLDERRKQIGVALRSFIPENLDVKGYVWVLLCPGSFGEI